MRHPCAKQAFAPRRARLRAMPATLRSAFFLPWLACVMAVAPLATQAQPVQAPHGLAGSDAWRENIMLGVDLWLVAHENARRALLLGRCTGLDRNFPRQPSPAMVAASNEVFQWMTGQAHADLPPEPYWAALRDVLPVVAKHGFSARELAAWDAWRDSPQGRRGIGASEIEEALYQVGDQLTEVSSGQPWGWPLARVARLADAHGFSAELDAAFEKTLGRGAAARLRRISMVPGETPADERLLDPVIQSGEHLAEAFVKRLSRPDRQARQTLERMGVLARWREIADALQQLTRDPALALRDQVFPPKTAAPGTVQAFCDRFGLPSCQPGGELDTAITRYRTAIAGAAHGDATSSAARQIVRAMPALGCPAAR